MRLEEMTVDDVRRLGEFCDTALVTLGGIGWRPPHLPTGTGWYILRRLRDMLEDTLGGRMVTLPVLGLGVEEDENVIFQVPKETVSDTVARGLAKLAERFPIRYVVCLTDHAAGEQALRRALERLAPDVCAASLIFVWWQDGLENESERYAPSGEVETSLLMAIAKRLVDLEQKSATRYSALQASVDLGEAYFAELQKSLLDKVQLMWGGGNSQTVV